MKIRVWFLFDAIFQLKKNKREKVYAYFISKFKYLTKIWLIERDKISKRRGLQSKGDPSFAWTKTVLITKKLTCFLFVWGVNGGNNLFQSIPDEHTLWSII